VLRGGVIVEQGNFKELSARKGVFAELIAAQSAGSEFLDGEGA
jgi:ABC-type multidrug transport system fused ATPase/permease subunit